MERLKPLTFFALFYLMVIGNPSLGSAQTTPIPDVSFELRLISLGYDSNGLTGDILNNDAEAVTYLDLAEAAISDLSGIEAFTALDTLDCTLNYMTSLDISTNTALTVLDCSSNQLTSLDVSANTALTVLGCFGNQLTSLDISGNTELEVLGCGYNQLTNLDVSANPVLEQLGVSQNQLTNLDVSTNTLLTSLNCSSNQLTNLDVGANTALTSFLCYGNELTGLDVSANTALHTLHCSGNQLTNLDVSSNAALTTLFCSDNQLANLDVSANTALHRLVCSSNQLVSLDMRNSDLTLFLPPTAVFNATSNPDLTCILVDNPNNIPPKISSGVDFGVYFSTTCSVSTEETSTGKSWVFGNASPNPLENGMIGVDYTSPKNMEINIQIIDPTGRIILEEQTNLLVGSHRLQLDCNALGRGMYIIRFYADDILVSRKFVVR